MMMIVIFAIFISIIIILMILFMSLVSMKTFMDREKSSPFECGFDPKSAARLPFSLHFFLIAVIFLIFDIEITLLIPFTLILKSSIMTNYFFLFSMFILILIGGLYHEWSQGSLTWSK